MEKDSIKSIEIQHLSLSSLLVRSTDDCVGLSTIPINPFLLCAVRISLVRYFFRGLARKLGSTREDEIVVDSVLFMSSKSPVKKLRSSSYCLLRRPEGKACLYIYKRLMDI